MIRFSSSITNHETIFNIYEKIQTVTIYNKGIHERMQNKNKVNITIPFYSTDLDENFPINGKKKLISMYLLLQHKNYYLNGFSVS